MYEDKQQHEIWTMGGVIIHMRQNRGSIYINWLWVSTIAVTLSTLVTSFLAFWSHDSIAAFSCRHDCQERCSAATGNVEAWLGTVSYLISTKDGSELST